jgi:hypothetical protein
VGLRLHLHLQLLHLVVGGDLAEEGVLQHIQLLLGLQGEVDWGGRCAEVGKQPHRVGVEDDVEVEDELVHLLLVGHRERLESARLRLQQRTAHPQPQRHLHSHR